MTEQLIAFEPGRAGVWQESGKRIRDTLDQLDALLKEAHGLPSEARHALRQCADTRIREPRCHGGAALQAVQCPRGRGREASTVDLRTMLQRARDGGERLRLITRNLKSLSRSDDTAPSPLCIWVT